MVSVVAREMTCTYAELRRARIRVAFAMGWVLTIKDLKAANAPTFQPAPRDEAWARILRRLADELESGEAVLKTPVSQERPAWERGGKFRGGPDITTTTTLHYPKVAAQLEADGFTSPARPTDP